MMKLRGENVGSAPSADNMNLSNTPSGMQQSATNFFPPGPVFGAKQDDPLIKAQTEKKVIEQKAPLEQQYNQSIKEIDKHFELRKKELMKQS